MVYGMENYIKILAVAIVLVFAGCKDWLDVTPAGQATESDLFSTGDVAISSRHLRIRRGLPVFQPVLRDCHGSCGASQ